MHKNIQKNKGFTLLEILLVIAAIGILAAIVLIAINPNRQLAQARNAIRQTDINTIQKAIDQQALDNTPGGVYLSAITNLTTPTEICGPAGGCGGGYIDLSSLVPNYIAVIPRDPQAISPGSGYKVRVNPANNKISVIAGLAENNKVIANNPLIPWTPASLGSALSFWSDANDETSMTLNNQLGGQTVSQWNDKSGNTRHLTQGTATQQPTLVRGVGNLLRYTQEFDNARWGKNNLSVIANNISAPDGSATVDRIVEDATNNQRWLGNGTTVAVSSTITASIYVKFESANRNFALQMTDAESGGTNYAGVRLEPNGTITASGTGFSNRSFSVITLPNGWFRVVFTFTTSSVSGIVFRAHILNAAGNFVYIGDGASGISLWGAMINTGATANEYIGRNNLLYDGTDDVMAITSATAGTVGVNNASLFIVMRQVTNPNTDISFALGHTGSGGNSRLLWNSSASANQRYAVWDNNLVTTLDMDVGGAFHTWAAIQSGQAVSITKDGNQDGAFPRNLPSTPSPIAANAITIGSQTGGAIASYYSHIEVMEAIASYSALSALDRQRMEGYLAWKWGLQANLPSGHPFISAPPIWGE